MINVKIVLKIVRMKMSKIKLNLKASNVNKVKWCNKTESNKKENLSGVSTSFNLMVWYS